jgi:ribonuclease HII
VGIDENGMGPRLGPLVVTGVLAQVDDRGRRVVTSRPRGALARRIGDSKKLVAFEDSALGEAWARALSSRAGLVARTPDELLAGVSLDAPEALRAPCPSHHAALCWNTHDEAFASDDASVAACLQDLDRLASKGVQIRRARVAIVCTRRLNDAVDQGLSRFDVDLHTMERLTLDARDAANEEVYAHCGKVGGFDFYGPRFGPLAGYLHTALVEGRARSEYQVPGVGRLAFVRDGDDTHLLIGLASLVGKWARDHLMRRVVRYHRAHDPSLPSASGYHDPVTARFVLASALIRRAQRIEPACFERAALGRATGGRPTSAARTTPKERPRPRPRPARTREGV